MFWNFFLNVILVGLLILRVFNDFNLENILFLIIVGLNLFCILFFKFNLVREVRLVNRLLYIIVILIIFCFKFKVLRLNNLWKGCIISFCILLLDKLM